MPLITAPHLDAPDDFYEALLMAHQDLSEADSHAFNARLVLLLANHIGRQDVLQAALAAAGASRINADSESASTNADGTATATGSANTTASTNANANANASIAACAAPTHPTTSPQGTP